MTLLNKWVKGWVGGWVDVRSGWVEEWMGGWRQGGSAGLALLWSKKNQRKFALSLTAPETGFFFIFMTWLLLLHRKKKNAPLFTTCERSPRAFTHTKPRLRTPTVRWDVAPELPTTLWEVLAVWEHRKSAESVWIASWWRALCAPQLRAGPAAHPADSNSRMQELSARHTMWWYVFPSQCIARHTEELCEVEGDTSTRAPRALSREETDEASSRSYCAQLTI
jgi:hypothetical protein